MSRILVVDDNLEVRTVIAMWLRRIGHEIVMAEDAEDALAKVAEHGQVHAAVLDVAMPGMNGLELLVRLREQPGLAGLPAVFVSARGKAEDIARGVNLGAAYIVKPFSTGQLTEVVNGLMTADQAATPGRL